MAGVKVGQTTRGLVAGTVVGLLAATAFGWAVHLLTSGGECGTGRPGVPECGPGLGQALALVFGGAILLFVALGVGGRGFVIVASVAGAGTGALLGGSALGIAGPLVLAGWLVVQAVAIRRRLRTAKALRKGVEAVATILSVEDTGQVRNEHPRVRLRMRVEPLFGIGPPYEAARTLVVNSGDVPRPGDRYPVRVHPRNPDEVHFAVAERGYVGNPSTWQRVVDAVTEDTVVAMPSRDVVRELTGLHQRLTDGQIDLDEYTVLASEVINTPVG